MGVIHTFSTRVSLSSLNVTMFFLFGRSNADHPSDAHLRLKNNDSTY